MAFRWSMVGISDAKDTNDSTIKFFNASDPDVPQQAGSNISFADALLKALYKVQKEESMGGIITEGL